MWLSWFCSVQFSCSVVSDSLRPYGLQYARLPCPSPTPGVCSNSCPSSQWCHPTFSSSVISFSSCLQSFPASGSFPMIIMISLGEEEPFSGASGKSVPPRERLPSNGRRVEWMPESQSRVLATSCLFGTHRERRILYSQVSRQLQVYWTPYTC